MSVQLFGHNPEAGCDRLWGINKLPETVFVLFFSKISYILASIGFSSSYLVGYLLLLIGSSTTAMVNPANVNCDQYSTHTGFWLSDRLIEFLPTSD